jgi:hypothetical protein
VNLSVFTLNSDRILPVGKYLQAESGGIMGRFWSLSFEFSVHYLAITVALTMISCDKVKTDAISTIGEPPPGNQTVKIDTCLTMCSPSIPTADTRDVMLALPWLTDTKWYFTKKLSWNVSIIQTDLAEGERTLEEEIADLGGAIVEDGDGSVLLTRPHPNGSRKFIALLCRPGRESEIRLEFLDSDSKEVIVDVTSQFTCPTLEDNAHIFIQPELILTTEKPELALSSEVRSGWKEDEIEKYKYDELTPIRMISNLTNTIHKDPYDLIEASLGKITFFHQGSKVELEVSTGGKEGVQANWPSCPYTGEDMVLEVHYGFVKHAIRDSDGNWDKTSIAYVIHKETPFVCPLSGRILNVDVQMVQPSAGENFDVEIKLTDGKREEDIWAAVDAEESPEYQNEIRIGVWPDPELISIK